MGPQGLATRTTPASQGRAGGQPRLWPGWPRCTEALRSLSAFSALKPRGAMALEIREASDL